MEVEFKKTISCCMDCPNHQVIRDPDPHDSFCSDDEAVLCTESANIEGKKHYYGPVFKYRPVTVSCRPYRKREETEVPLWCPLIKHKNEPLLDVGL